MNVGSGGGGMMQQQQQRGGDNNRILVIEVQNPKYPITVVSKDNVLLCSVGIINFDFVVCFRCIVKLTLLRCRAQIKNMWIIL